MFLGERHAISWCSPTIVRASPAWRLPLGSVLVHGACARCLCTVLAPVIIDCRSEISLCPSSPRHQEHPSSITPSFPINHSPSLPLVRRLYTINLHKRLHKITFKERAPRAIREIKKFAIKALGTKDVRVDTGYVAAHPPSLPPSFPPFAFRSFLGSCLLSSACSGHRIWVVGFFLYRIVTSVSCMLPLLTHLPFFPPSLSLLVIQPE